VIAALGEPVDIGRERELSTELRARNPGRKWAGIPVPDEVFRVERRALGDNVMLTSGVAADLYPTQHRPDLFIDRLRSQLVVERLGATVLRAWRVTRTSRGRPARRRRSGWRRTAPRPIPRSALTT
jgi:hypothetical protein